MAYGNLKFHLLKKNLGRYGWFIVFERLYISQINWEEINIVDTISIPWSWFTADVRLIVLLCFIFFCSIRKGILLICFILEPFDENMFSLLFLKEKKNIFSLWKFTLVWVWWAFTLYIPVYYIRTDVWFLVFFIMWYRLLMLKHNPYRDILIYLFSIL